MIKFRESGHPVFRATSPMSRGTLKSKWGGQLSILFCADGDTIETVLRTIISVNQLSIYEAVSDLCEEYGTCQTRTGRPVWAGQSDPLFETFDWNSCTRRSIAKVSRTSGEGYHNKIVWLNFVLMHDTWQQLMSDSTSWHKTLKNSHNLLNKWNVVSTLVKKWKIISPERLDPREHQNWARIGSHNQLPAK